MLYLDYSRKEGEWQPNMYGGRENLEAIDFLKKFNEEVHRNIPGVLTIAEESTAWPGVSRPTYLGGLGFSLKWNMGWMNDTREYMHKDPIHRKFHQDELTFSLIYAFTENFCCRCRTTKWSTAKARCSTRCRATCGRSSRTCGCCTATCGPTPARSCLFMGGEFGQWHEWNHDESPQWHLLQWQSHQGVQRLVADLNALYNARAGSARVDFESAGFEWIDCHDGEEQHRWSFIRKAKDPKDCLIVVLQLHACAARKLSPGCPRTGLLERVAELRRNGLRRQRNG